MIRLKLHRNFRRTLLFQPGIAADIARRARNVQAAAGPDYEVDTRRGKNRPRAQVRTANSRAARAEADTRRLTSALDAARR